MLTNLKEHIPEVNLSFYRTTNGAEIDIIAETAKGIYAIGCKSSLSPKLNKGNRFAIDTIKPDHTFIAAPICRGAINFQYKKPKSHNGISFLLPVSILSRARKEFSIPEICLEVLFLPPVSNIYYPSTRKSPLSE